MTRLATTASAVALCFGAVPAFADLSPEQVWEEIQGLYEGTYNEVSFDGPTQDGDALLIENLSLAMGDDDVEIAFVVPEMRLRAADADTVEITTSEQYDVVVSGDTADMPEEFTIDLRQSGLLVTATGAPEDIDWTYAADSITIAMRAISEADEVGIDGKAVLNNLSGDISSSQVDELYSFDGTYNVASATMEIAAQTPDGPFEMAIASNEISYALDGAVPLGLFAQENEPSMPEMIEAGFRVNLASQSGGANVDAKGSVDGAAFDANVTTQPSETSFNFGPDGIVVDTNLEGFAFRVEGDALPDVIEASLERLAVNYMFPVSEGDEPQAFGMGWSLINLTLADSVWDQFDPDAHLERSPLTFDLALSGLARISEGFWDAEEPDFEQADLESLSLERLLMSAIGAELTGQGSFEMQGEPNIAFGGLPTPVGKANFSLTGLNAALDALVAAQLVPEEQLFGIRMGLGMVAVSDGDDSYTSEVEVTEDGAVLVNGNRMR